MNAIINAAFSRSRVVLMALVMVLGVGGYAYLSIPKEANPEVPLPLFYVSTGLDGIQPAGQGRVLRRDTGRIAPFVPIVVGAGRCAELLIGLLKRRVVVAESDQRCRAD